jgi:hypothetical protein
VLTRPTRGSLASLRLDAPSIVRRYGWSRKLTRNSRGWPGERPISTPCASFDVENVPDISCGFPARATTGRAAFLRPRRSAPYPPPPRRRRSSPATNQPHPPPRSSSPARAKGNIWSGSVRPPRRRLRRPGTGGGATRRAARGLPRASGCLVEVRLGPTGPPGNLTRHR